MVFITTLMEVVVLILKVEVEVEVEEGAASSCVPTKKKA